MFSILVILFSLPLKKIRPAGSRVFLVILLAAWGYGIAMEFVQKYYIPLRSFDIADIIADGVGCLLGFYFTRYLLHREAIKKQTGR